jgi:UDP-N-acetylmuramoylalanine--D-glutamate ligase
MIEVAGKKVVVIGAGKSGISSVKLLLKKGANVILSEIKNSSKIQEFKKLNVKIEVGKHSKEIIKSAEFIIVSPGVPLNIDVIKYAKKLGIPILSEIELGYQFFNGKIIGITGTKGKSTTVMLTYQILKSAGLPVALGGNIGIPLTSIVEKKGVNIIVAEISSFQLESIIEFRPYISAITNITLDHMDRYNNFQSYLEAKSKILVNQTNNDYSILNYENKFSYILANMTKAKRIFFSSKRKIDNGVWLENNEIFTNIHNKIDSIINVEEIKIKGQHNIENAMIAIAISYLFNIKKEIIRKVLSSFKGLPHREEFVTKINGVTFINNSQGTNIDAVEKSLSTYDSPIILIAGGRNKGGNFEKLKKIVKEKVKFIFAIGEAKDEIAKSLGNVTRIIKSSSLEEAVYEAYKNSKEGDIVLLSPGCASFDMFKNYEERGEIFKKIVYELKRNETKN